MSTPILNASSRIMYEEAKKRGIDLTVFGDNETILMKKGNKSWYTRGSRTSLQSSVGHTFAKMKTLTKAILNHYDLPTAKSVSVENSEEIQKLNDLSFPIVMKPTEGAHGRNVVVDIKNIKEAKKHFEEYLKPVIFEEMLEGIEYRVVCIDFKFVAAAFRKPAFVIGDGDQTVQQLVNEKNKHPWREEGHRGNLSLIKIDNAVTKYLEEQNLTLESIPTKNSTVYLRKTANLSTGGEAWDVTKTVCPENIELFTKIAKACDLNNIGIDMMCQSLESPIINQKNAGVIEVNASPGLRMHHFPLKGEPINVAGKILDMVEENI